MASGANMTHQDLRTLFEAGTFVGLSDGQILERFISRREEAALEALMHRHGPMVWGVCRRVLLDHHDAEDAFQATFLVLARRAASVVPREKVGNWLYGVAYQTARKARAMRAKRRLRESQVQGVPERAAPSDVPTGNLSEWLDHELSRLPEKYRTPIVLCELEGKTHGEAAAHLGWPIGTVSGRLSRARAMLAKRLTRRGVSISGGSLFVLLAQQPSTASAAVPASLISSTITAATLFAAGRTATAGLASPGAAALTEEVLRAMLFHRIKIIAGAFLLVALAGAGLWQAAVRAGGPPPAQETFRVTVNELIHDHGTLVAQIDIEAPQGAAIDLVADKPSKGGGSSILSTGVPATARFIVLGDQVEWEGGPTKAVKFMLAQKTGSISTSFSEAGPMPDTAKQLSDLLTMPIKSGEYKLGEATKMVTFKGTTYNLVVTRSK
jgi:RNA polymerase sigma-70 factor (ECF subfamily)